MLRNPGNALWSCRCFVILAMFCGPANASLSWQRSVVLPMLRDPGNVLWSCQCSVILATLCGPANAL
eukprot:505163-Pelagomonas_calceolata.AAC.1